MLKPDVSIIVPFRNRDLQRLEIAIRSARDSAGAFTSEVIVSDFGTEDAEGVREVCEATGAVWHRLEADHWNKSVCVNSALQVANGDFIQTDDADILWAPHALERGLKTLQSDPGAFINFQVWDLPEHLTEQVYTAENWAWEDLRNSAVAHSRWGHGLVLAPRECFASVRGLDERMHTYGGEDLDITRRIRAAGWRQIWAGNSGDELFHIWHPRVKEDEKADPVSTAAIRANRKLFREDSSVVRNTTKSYPSWAPTVSVVIATQNRAELLSEAIVSCLYQTVSDFEIVVVDDGSTDNTMEVLASFDDPRVRWVRLDSPRGIAAARNLGTQQARGEYIAVLDDDDLMVPDRLERQLQAMEPGVHGCVGNIVNFDDQTGEFVIWGDARPIAQAALPKGGFAAHPTWLVRRELLEGVPYDETLTSAVDNNVAMRALRAGARFSHLGRVVTMRRRHSLQVTATDSKAQKIGAALTKSWFQSQSGDAEITEAIRTTVPLNVRAEEHEDPASLSQWLPDHLVRRAVEIMDTSSEAMNRLPWLSDLQDRLTIISDDGLELTEPIIKEDASWRDLLELRRSGIDHKVRTIDPEKRVPDVFDWLPTSARPGSIHQAATTPADPQNRIRDAMHKITQELRSELSGHDYLLTWWRPGKTPMASAEAADPLPGRRGYDIQVGSHHVRFETQIVHSPVMAASVLAERSTETHVYRGQAKVSLAYLMERLAEHAESEGTSR